MGVGKMAHYVYAWHWVGGFHSGCTWSGDVALPARLGGLHESVQSSAFLLPTNENYMRGKRLYFIGILHNRGNGQVIHNILSLDLLAVKMGSSFEVDT